MLYYLVHRDNEIKQKMVRPNSEFKESCLLRAEKNKISRKLYVIKRVMTTMLYNLHPNKPLENIEGQYHPKEVSQRGLGTRQSHSLMSSVSSSSSSPPLTDNLRPPKMLCIC